KAEWERAEAAIDKWEQEYKLATGKDVNDVELKDTPPNPIEGDSEIGAEPRDYSDLCICWRKFSDGHNRTCVEYREWRREQVERQQKFEKQINEKKEEMEREK
ncbi:hypothetical protein PFISCL1PPCAC_21845, partial [Pristionchus fissidentatus]